MLSYGIDRVLPFAIDRLFDIAADVESYPRYFPNWEAARVLRRHDDGYETEQVLRYGPVRERFRSYTRVEPPVRILVDSSSRTFRRFQVAWGFEDLAGVHGGAGTRRTEPATRVILESKLEFRSGLLERVMKVAISDSIRPFIDAFEREVQARTSNDHGAMRGGTTSGGTIEGKATKAVATHLGKASAVGRAGTR